MRAQSQLHLCTNTFTVLRFSSFPVPKRTDREKPNEEEEDDNEDCIITSPIDEIEVYTLFLEIVSGATMKDPAMTSTLQKRLGREIPTIGSIS